MSRRENVERRGPAGQARVETPIEAEYDVNKDGVIDVIEDVPILRVEVCE